MVAFGRTEPRIECKENVMDCNRLVIAFFVEYGAWSRQLRPATACTVALATAVEISISYHSYWAKHSLPLQAPPASYITQLPGNLPP